MRDLAIKIEGLGKRYRVGSSTVFTRTFVELVSDAVRRIARGRSDPQWEQRNQFWALRDVEIAVPAGRVLGLIGPNGAGKSTLLKILSRITDPTEGQARVRGRVGSLLEVGTGFHPELTGRENIYLNGAILGMTRREIRGRFDEIVAFSDVERFLDTPVKRYSSGMYVRLAFAVAAHLQPEILLVDEVLAVGDAAFQKKCLGRMRDVADAGRTVLFVSHNMAAVESLCDSAIRLEQGRVADAGEPAEVVAGYLQPRDADAGPSLVEREDRDGTGVLRFTDLQFVNVSTGHTGLVRCGDELELHLHYACPGEGVHHASVSVVFHTPAGQCMFMLNNEMVGHDFARLPRTGVITCRIPRLPLAPGAYDINLHCSVNHQVADWVQRAASFNVETGDYYGTGRLPPVTHGGMLMPHTWSLAA